MRLTILDARLAAAALLLALAACEKQPAAPLVEPPNTRGLKVSLQQDTALFTTTPKLAPASGVRMNVRRLGDTLVLRQITLDTRGEAVIVGLEPGTYVISPAVGEQSTFLGGRAADTVTVTAASGTDTAAVAARTLQVRRGATLSGTLSADFIGPTGRVVTRFPNVSLQILRETGSNTGVYAPLTTVTTDASGSFSLPVAPGPERFRITFDAATLQNFPSDSLLLGGTGTSVQTRGTTTVTVANVAPGATRSASGQLTYRFNNRINVNAFRDANKNGTRDAGEVLVAGDTVGVQLRDAAGERVLGTARIVATSTALNPQVNFSSLRGGTYQITLDPLTTRLKDVTGTASAAPATRSVSSLQPTAVSVDLALQLP